VGEVTVVHDALKSPVNLPGGSTAANKTAKDYHEYSYNRSLPGGGSISSVHVSSGYGGKIVMRGTDNDGVRFTTNYTASKGDLYHSMSNPKFTSGDIDVLYEVAIAFTKSYGL